MHAPDPIMTGLSLKLLFYFFLVVGTNCVELPEAQKEPAKDEFPDLQVVDNGHIPDDVPLDPRNVPVQIDVAKVCHHKYNVCRLA